MNTSVTEIKKSPNEAHIASEVVLKDGTCIPADVIVMAVGVAPATEFLKESGFKLERDGGVLVDEYLKVPDVGDCVYAIGDIAVFPQVENKTPRRIEHWNVRWLFSYCLFSGLLG